MTNKQISFLTTSQILFIHDQMVKRLGGSHGIRDMGLVESAVARPQVSQWLKEHSVKISR